MKKIINRDKNIVPACDVPLNVYLEILDSTKDIEEVGGYKIGFFLALEYGLPELMDITREYTDKPVIYDHQKAGTDVPFTGEKFIDVCKRSGVDAVILFPQSGPETERAWIEYAMERDLGVIVGGLMTHPKYVRSEGGYIDDEAIMEMYLNAAELGVTDFVVPGNRPEDIKEIKKSLEEKGVSPVFYAPGFIRQKGKMSETSKVIGDKWHAIVGSGIYNAADKKEAALKLAKFL